MAEQGHTHRPIWEIGEANLQEVQNALLEELQSLVGQRRANALYRAHVSRSNILLVHGAGERETMLAEELRGRLMEEGRVVEGPWSIIGGENMLDAWQRLSSKAVAVVVLLSPTLFQDTVLCSCLTEMQHFHCDTIVPLFLEPLSLQALPPSLAFLANTIGRVVPENHWDPQSFIRSLLERCRRLRIVCQEIEDLHRLVDELSVNTNYVCPCGTC